MEYHVQSRWNLQGRKLVYYGLRNKDHLFENEIRLSRKQAALIASLPGELNDLQKKSLHSLLGVQIVLKSQLKKIPDSVEEATFCKNCCANDFMIPGIEFDEKGLCPLCQAREEEKGLGSLVPVVTEIPRAKHSRFDAALFYTGGKDSTFLLYYLSEVMGLRILAMTWEIPWMSENAKQSIENAKQRLKQVEFISRTVKRQDLTRIYQKLYALNGNTCACPSLAYVLFYLEMVANRVPYFLVGNEPVQMLGLFYNHMAPKFAYSFEKRHFLNALISIGRVLTLHPPLKKGQLHTLMTMKQLAYGGNPIKEKLYPNELLSNVTEALHSVPELFPPLKRAIRSSSRSGRIPAFVHLDFNALCGGRYDWKNVKDLLVKTCGWVPPADAEQGLHTSCRIERCKEHSQFVRFRDCDSRMIPFSALELALASRDHYVTREEAIRELKNTLGFCREPVCEYALMRKELEESS